MVANIRPLSGPRLPPARGEATHLVVLVHGYGADGNDLIGLAPHLQKLAPTAAFVAPNAPEPAPGSAGYQWFPIARLDPAEMERGVTGASAGLNGFLDSELKRLDLPGERLVLVGFSQGTMLSLSVGLHRATPPAAIIGYSGMLTGRPRPLGPAAPPVMLAHGDADQVIPVDAMFFSASELGAAGARVEWHLCPGIGHGIDPKGLSAGANFLSLAMRGLLRARDGEIACALG